MCAPVFCYLGRPRTWLSPPGREDVNGPSPLKAGDLASPRLPGRVVIIVLRSRLAGRTNCPSPTRTRGSTSATDTVLGPIRPSGRAA